MTTWAAETTQRIGAAIKATRGSRSAQWLADQTERLGHPISRTAISEYETGKRKSMPVTDLLVLALALEVPPLQLVFPQLPDGPVEPWPGEQVPAYQAVEWMAGHRSPEYAEGQPLAWKSPAPGPLGTTWTWLRMENGIALAAQLAKETGEMVRITQARQVAGVSPEAALADYESARRNLEDFTSLRRELKAQIQWLSQSDG